MICAGFQQLLGQFCAHTFGVLRRSLHDGTADHFTAIQADYSS